MYPILKFLSLACVIALWSCNNNEAGDDRIKIVTTTGMIADAVQNSINDGIEVTALMGPGIDPHLYKAAQGDLKLLEEADIIIYNGLHLEGKMSDIFEKLARTKPVYAISDGIAKEKLRQASEQDAIDPHIWFNVHLWSEGISSLQQWLLKSHPEIINKQSAKQYISQLDSLNKKTQMKVSSIPEDQRVLVTAHDAFGYFGDAYAIEVKGLQGISTVAQAGLRDVNELVNMLVERKVKAIFVESSIPKKQIEVVIENCKEKGHNLTIGGTLYSDAMGAPSTPEGTYIGMVSHNVQTIVNALK